MVREFNVHLKSEYDSAHFLSKINFFWVWEFFLKHFGKELCVADLYLSPKYDRSESLGSKVERAWYAQLEKQKSGKGTAPLLKALLSVFGAYYFLLGILVTFIQCVLIIGQAVVMGFLIRDLSKMSSQDESPEELRTKVWLFGLAVVAIQALIVMMIHPFYFETFRMGMDIRIACCHLIYKKSLRLSQSALAKTSVGQIVNFLSNDVNRFDWFPQYPSFLIVGPLMALISTYVLYESQKFGFACLPGVGILFLYIPLQAVLGKVFTNIREKTANLTDERVRITNEFVKAMKVIKMYAWEGPFAAVVDSARRKEVEMIKKASYLRGLNLGLFFVSGKVIIAFMIVTFVVFKPDMSLTAEMVFVAIALVNNLRHAVCLYVPYAVSTGSEALVSLKRIQEFLLLDDMDQGPDQEVQGKEAKVTLDSVSAKYKHVQEELLSNISFDSKPGQLLAVIGSVGSGKSSVLMTLLGELPVISGKMSIKGKVAYASQEAWTFPGSVKENILFGEDYDPKKYREVIRVCALERDLALLPNEDKTIIGDSAGLSGGQRARVNLARALYTESDIYLLDDPLSAVDASVAKHIFEQAIKGYLADKIVILVTHQLQFIKSADRILLLQAGKTLVYGEYTDILSKGFDFIKFNPDQAPEPLQEAPATSGHDLPPGYDGISTSSTGGADMSVRVRRSILQRTISGVSHRSVSSMCSTRSRVESILARKESSAIVDMMHSSPMAPKPINAALDLNDNESIGIGGGADGDDFQTGMGGEENTGDDLKAGGKAYWTYITTGGGCMSIFFIITSLVISQALFSFNDLWLSWWTNYLELNSYNITMDEANDVLAANPTLAWDQEGNLWSFSLQTVIVAVLAIGRTIGFFVMCMKSSVKLHDRLFRCLVRAPMTFFDNSPIGILLNRCSRDMGIIDDILPPTFFDALSIALMDVGIAVMICIIDPWITIPTAILIGLSIAMHKLYVNTARNIKRIEGVTRSPVFSHLATTLNGLTTVRAYRAQERFTMKFDVHQDQHTASWFMFLSASRWFGVVLDWLCAVYIGAITVSMLSKLDGSNGALVGLAITSALNLANGFQWGIRQATEVETQMTSVERVDEFSHLPSEAPLEAPEHAKPKPEWPQKGKIDFFNVSLEYSPEDGPVLRNLTFTIEDKEKIGIVGRTGAGKSSMISSLFRLAEPTGEIVIDGVDICSIGLHDIRRKLSIIPQTPVLFSGTIRKNLDPFGGISDGKLWRALDEVQLRETVQDISGGLDATISSEGSDFSVGQRQLLCLARAIIRKNKVLILDEATANVDPKTDSLIQATIRKNFGDCTILTIAHRLDTIIDSDRVLVLDAGENVEFDEPLALLKCEEGIFNSMVKATGKDTATKLKLMAQKAHDERMNQRKIINENN